VPVRPRRRGGHRPQMPGVASYPLPVIEGHLVALAVEHLGEPHQLGGLTVAGEHPVPGLQLLVARPPGGKPHRGGNREPGVQRLGFAAALLTDDRHPRREVTRRQMHHRRVVTGLTQRRADPRIQQHLRRRAALRGRGPRRPTGVRSDQTHHHRRAQQKRGRSQRIGPIGRRGTLAPVVPGLLLLPRPARGQQTLRWGTEAPGAHLLGHPARPGRDQPIGETGSQRGGHRPHQRGHHPQVQPDAHPQPGADTHSGQRGHITPPGGGAHLGVHVETGQRGGELTQQRPHLIGVGAARHDRGHHRLLIGDVMHRVRRAQAVRVPIQYSLAFIASRRAQHDRHPLTRAHRHRQPARHLRGIRTGLHIAGRHRRRMRPQPSHRPHPVQAGQRRDRLRPGGHRLRQMQRSLIRRGTIGGHQIPGHPPLILHTHQGDRARLRGGDREGLSPAHHVRRVRGGSAGPDEPPYAGGNRCSHTGEHAQKPTSRPGPHRCPETQMKIGLRRHTQIGQNTP